MAGCGYESLGPKRRLDEQANVFRRLSIPSHGMVALPQLSMTGARWAKLVKEIRVAAFMQVVWSTLQQYPLSQFSVCPSSSLLKVKQSQSIFSLKVNIEFSVYVSGYQKNTSTKNLLFDNNPGMELVSALFLLLWVLFVTDPVSDMGGSGR